MFWVESRLRVCMWDPAHGKPYASAQLALSFGVEGVGACFHKGTVQTAHGRHELYPYRAFIESSQTKDAHLGIRWCFMWDRHKGQRSLGSPHSDITGVTLWKPVPAFYLIKAHLSYLKLASLPSSSYFLPIPWLILPSLPRGSEGSREDFRAAGGDRLSVPSTYTNGRISAPHKNN